MMQQQDTYMVVAEEKLKKLHNEAKLQNLRPNAFPKNLRRTLATTMRHLADKLEPKPNMNERML